MQSNSIKTSLPVFLAFFVMGFVDVVGIATSYVKKDFELSASTANLLPMMVFVWFAILSIPVGIALNKYGKKKILNVGIGLTFVAMLLPFMWYSFPTALISFVIIGIGNTIIQVAANPLLHDISRKEQYASNMSFSQLIKAIASLLGPILATSMASGMGNWRYIFVFYALVSVLNYLWLASVQIEEAPANETADFKSSIALLKQKDIFLLTLGILAIVGIDVGINTNIVPVLQAKFGMSIEAASMGIKVYFLSLIAARFLGGIILRKVPSRVFMIASLLLAVTCLAGLYTSSSEMVALACVVGIGLGTANIFPIIFAQAIELLPERANEISGLMIMSVCGGAIFPFLMGVVSDSFGARESIAVLAICTLYILAIALRKPKAAAVQQ